LTVCGSCGGEVAAEAFQLIREEGRKKIDVTQRYWACGSKQVSAMYESNGALKRRE